MADSIDLSNAWHPTPKNLEIRASPAPNRLRVGGTGSSKSSDCLWEVLNNYLLHYPGIQVLWLRKAYPDLEKSTIADLKALVPREIYKYNDQKHIATFYNKSRLFFGHLQNNSEQDLQQYLSAAFPVIVIDECGQISGEAYQFLQSRNRLNPECKPGEEGRLPYPVMLTCTNPIGPHWPWYRAQFVEKRPFEVPEGARKDKNDRWWIQQDGKWHCVYNPDDWAFVHTTLLDNPYLMQRDPTLYNRLMGLPKDMREKLLHGNLDAVSGQYFDCWDPSIHVVNLRNDPKKIRWQAWQPKWMGWDAGRAHYSAAYWMTRAEVRNDLDGSYRSKVVVYRELVQRGKDNHWWAQAIAEASINQWEGWDADSKRVEIGTPERLVGIWYSHEQFSQRMEAHTPAQEMSALLHARGLPGVSKGTRDPASSASFVYNMLARHQVVILDTCPELIRAIPSLMRDEDNPEKVHKAEQNDTAQKADDCWDGFRHGLYGMLSNEPVPKDEKVREHASGIKDPLAKWLYTVKNLGKRDVEVINPDYKPLWMKEL